MHYENVIGEHNFDNVFILLRGLRSYVLMKSRHHRETNRLFSF